MTKSISAKDYFQFLHHIHHVAKEKDLPISNVVPLLQVSSDAIIFLPDFSMDTVLKKVKSICAEKLFLFEAAKRANLTDLAEKFLQKWTKQINKKEPHEWPAFVSLLDILHKREIQSPDIRIKNLKDKIYFPKFSQPTEVENLLLARVKHLLVKQIIFEEFHPNEVSIPPHVAQVLFSINLTATELFLVEKYKNVQKTIKFSKNLLIGITDKHIQTYLKRFPSLETLDLENCISISYDAFQDGHLQLKNLILTGTSLNPIYIDKNKFPALTHIIQENQKSILNLQKFLDENKNKDSELVLKDIIQTLQSVDEIIIGNNTYLLLDDFINNRDKDTIFIKIQFILQLLKKIHLFKYTSHQNVKAYDLFKLLIYLFFQIRAKDWNEDNALRQLVTHTIKQRLQEEVSLPSKEKYFTYWISKDLGMTRVNRSNYKECVTGLDENKKARIRFILRLLLNFEISIEMSPVVEKLKKRMFELDKLRMTLRDTERNLEIEKREFINEIFVEISYLIDQQNNETISLKKFNFLNPYYENYFPFSDFKKTLAQTIASMFALKVTHMEERQKQLETFYKNYNEYQTNSTHYFLPKILLGVIEEIDIPHWDQDSLLKKRLLQYKGILFESISEDLKQEYWNGLVNGKFGGITLSLIDAFYLFYLRSEEPYKQKALNALKELGGYPSVGALSNQCIKNPVDLDPIKKYASEKIDSLQK